MVDRSGGRRVSRRRLMGAVAAGGAGLGGCLGDDDSASGPELEILHPWTGPAARAAMDAVVAAFEDAHPDVPTDFFANSGDTPYDELVGNRLDSDAPPSSFACRPGRNLERYRRHLGAVADDVRRSADPSAVSVPEVRELCRVDDERVAVPVGAYRTNHLFYDVRAVDDAGVDPDPLSTPADLVDALELVAENTDATPLAHALQGPWSTLQLFAAVLLGQEGPDAYATFVGGEGAGDAVRRALETTETILSNYVADDAGSIVPVEATASFARGEAAFLQQGTWAATDLREDGYAHGEDWGSVAFPGAEGTFALHLDSFVAPVDDAGENPSPRATETWLDHVADAGVQETFNARRGSVPTRTDASTGPFDPFLTGLIEQFRAADRRPPSLAHGLAVAPDRLSEMESVVAESFAGPFDVEATAAGLLDAVRT